MSGHRVHASPNQGRRDGIQPACLLFSPPTSLTSIRGLTFYSAEKEADEGDAEETKEKSEEQSAEKKDTKEKEEEVKEKKETETDEVT